MTSPQITYRQISLVIELRTALHIGQGKTEGRSDAAFVRDFNGLPAIPGTGGQGMLKSAMAAIDEQAAMRLFGSPGSSDSTDKGQGGRVWVGWASIHDKSNNPVTERRTRASLVKDDEVLRDALAGSTRDHVRLNERGVVDGKGKFDELVVNPGHRFSLKLRFATATDERQRGTEDAKRVAKLQARAEDDWQLLLQVLSDPGLRLGGKTRRGFGAFKIESGHWKEESSRDEKHEEEHKITQAKESEFMKSLFDGKLSAETLWMFGGGLSAETDSTAVSGTWIKWTGNTGKPEDVWIIPGSSVKGALVHRTRFHANRLAGNFIDARDPEKDAQVTAQLDDLFGTIKGKSGDGQPGRIFIDDIYLPKTSVPLADVQNHVAINPFTGGAKDSALFDDQPLRPGDDLIPLSVQASKNLTAEQTKPLIEALRDLCAGRLNLGGHASRGYGCFTAENPDFNPQLIPA
jgi:CRISPR/Cas system CSM-associated protein Csm3 (group 7 of RAMP superfamily)